MIYVSATDALRALKTFKRLAKQDLLASGLMEEPQFWRRQAESRRAMYDALMRVVEDEGVEAAHRFAVNELAALPLFRSESFNESEGLDGGTTQARFRGKQQALQLFVSFLGVDEERTALPSA